MLRTKENRRILCAAALLAGLFFTAASAATAQQSGQGVSKEQVARISPQAAYPQIIEGKALLVCAYENEKTCSTIMLERAITLKEFEGRLAGLKKDQPIIFYCA
jgi:hypothetical protein